jgi:UDP:flavonoid glycosyltransferase YjiC (YdhE family)
MTGFPLYDDRPDGASLPAEVRSFIEQGDPPIAFTPGTGMMHGHLFFEAAVQACQLLGRRGILLTKYTEQLPKNLPSSVRHFGYVPFSQLLPHLAALVHHGGVGSLAQAMAAGIPQLVMPLAYDQPDNAKRLKRLGVGDSLKPKAFRGPAVAKKLRHLLDSPEVAARCQTLARKVDGAKSREATCDLIEQLVENPVASAACA